MSVKRSKLDVAADRAAKIIQAHLDTLPPAKTKAMRADSRKLAIKSPRSAGRGKVSQSRQNVGFRPLSRTCEESA
jgi:hypothetical protein